MADFNTETDDGIDTITESQEFPNMNLKLGFPNRAIIFSNSPDGYVTGDGGLTNTFKSTGQLELVNKSCFIRVPNLTHKSYNGAQSSMSKILYQVPQFTNVVFRAWWEGLRLSQQSGIDALESNGCSVRGSKRKTSWYSYRIDSGGVSYSKEKILNSISLRDDATMTKLLLNKIISILFHNINDSCLDLCPIRIFIIIKDYNSIICY